MTISDNSINDLMADENQPVQDDSEVEPSPQVEGMITAGVHLGHRASKLHPRMEPLVVGLRNTIHVIDLEATVKYLDKALDFISKLKKDGKSLILVGTKPPLRPLVKQTAEELGLPFVTERWLGGTFTNFPVIRARVKYYSDLEAKKAAGELEKYTKKEVAQFEKELADLKRKFEGIVNMDKLPDAIFVCDIVHDKLVLKEAKERGIKTIGIIDTNADPMAVDYPIPANDDSITAVKYILDRVKEVILEAENNS
ncbi:MAG: 30S ribosomal protein S2 [Candidatus Pacebacteria bacterium]|nr:30S ribosomal protein S2 [Candidatus Paceibacterota bacterium]